MYNKIDLKGKEFDKISKKLRELVAKHRLPTINCSAFENDKVEQVIKVNYYEITKKLKVL